MKPGASPARAATTVSPSAQRTRRSATAVDAGLNVRTTHPSNDSIADTPPGARVPAYTSAPTYACSVFFANRAGAAPGASVSSAISCG